MSNEWNIDWSMSAAAIFRRGQIRPVRELAFVDIDELVGLDEQKDALLKNTQNFLQNKAANHALLWGQMGCGKSSLVRAVFCKFINDGLRLIEINKNELEFVDEILQFIRFEKYKFIIFCDDFSFEAQDQSYKNLRPILEGSIEAVPKNVLFYATSNKKHLVPRSQNSPNFLIEKEKISDELSLSDRFGLWISFYELEVDEYLEVVRSIFGAKFDENVAKKSLAYARLRGFRSPRVARQFANLEEI